MGLQQTNDTNFEQLLSENEKVIVKYYAGWCGNCRLIAPKFKKLAEDERFSDITFLDVDAENSPLARKTAGVDNLPFFATFIRGEKQEGMATSVITSVEEMIVKLQGAAHENS